MIDILKRFTVVFMIFMICFYVSAEDTVTFIADMDGYIYEQLKSSSYMTGSALNWVGEGKNGWSKRPVVHFDLSDSDLSLTEIGEVELRLYLQLYGKSGKYTSQSAIAYLITNLWDEATGCWNNILEDPDTVLGSVAVTTNDSYSYISIPIDRSVVLGWLSDASSNYGIMIKGTGGWSTPDSGFASREAGDSFAPLLVITKTPAPPKNAEIDIEVKYDGYIYAQQKDNTSLMTQSTMGWVGDAKGNWDKRPVVRFDLTDSGYNLGSEDVRAAFLNICLGGYSANYDSQTANFYVITNSWDEITGCWNTIHHDSSRIVGSREVEPEDSYTYISIPIDLDVVHDWLDNPDKNFGLMLRGTGGWDSPDSWFYARESTADLPAYLTLLTYPEKGTMIIIQ